jgi:hypothetical protein
MSFFYFSNNAKELHTRAHQNLTKLNNEPHTRTQYQDYATKHELFVFNSQKCEGYLIYQNFQTCNTQQKKPHQHQN